MADNELQGLLKRVEWRRCEAEDDARQFDEMRRSVIEGMQYAVASDWLDLDLLDSFLQCIKNISSAEVECYSNGMMRMVQEVKSLAAEPSAEDARE